jgi:hypothetical protein
MCEKRYVTTPAVCEPNKKADRTILRSWWKTCTCLTAAGQSEPLDTAEMRYSLIQPPCAFKGF